MEILSKSLSDTQKVAEDLLKEITTNNVSAKVVAFYGNLGSGKTTFIQFLAKALNINDRVLSPTFVIEKIYRIKNSSQFTRLIHIDAYRLDEAKELLSLRWEDIVANPKNLIVVEWGERVEELLPESALKVYLEFIDEDKRSIKW